MQEEIENKSVTLIINGGRFSGRMLRAAIAKFLSFTGQQLKKRRDVQPRGRQSVKQLIGQNQGVNSIDLAGQESVRAFDRFARKYGVDYAIKKVDGSPPKYVLFFKAKDADAITSAFQEYTDAWKNRGREHRVSIRKLLRQFGDVAFRRNPNRARNRDVSR